MISHIEGLLDAVENYQERVITKKSEITEEERKEFYMIVDFIRAVVRAELQRRAGEGKLKNYGLMI